MTPQKLADQILVEVNEDISARHKAKDYRPIATIILRDQEGLYLFVQSAKNEDWWGLPQGGVDPGEDIIAGYLRELHEETGIEKDQIRIVKYCGSNQIDIPTENRDGFQKGKRYYYFLSVCLSEVIVVPEPSEILGYQWVSLEDAKKLISNRNEEKQRTILEAMSKI